MVLGDGAPKDGVLGDNSGAGCKGGLAEFGKVFADGAEPNAFEFENGDAFVSAEVEPNPLEGVLLNISKPLAVLPPLEANGLGPETSGMV
jgi:hypothetical protein